MVIIRRQGLGFLPRSTDSVQSCFRRAYKDRVRVQCESEAGEMSPITIQNFKRIGQATLDERLLGNLGSRAHSVQSSSGVQQACRSGFEQCRCRSVADSSVNSDW